jgi:hypothetical protein
MENTDNIDKMTTLSPGNGKIGTKRRTQWFRMNEKCEMVWKFRNCMPSELTVLKTYVSRRQQSDDNAVLYLVKDTQEIWEWSSILTEQTAIIPAKILINF